MNDENQNSSTNLTDAPSLTTGSVNVETPTKVEKDTKTAEVANSVNV